MSVGNKKEVNKTKSCLKSTVSSREKSTGTSKKSTNIESRKDAQQTQRPSKKPTVERTLSQCVNMTKTSQLRRSLNKKNNSSRSESVQNTPKPNLPRRTSSLQPTDKIGTMDIKNSVTTRTESTVDRLRTGSFVVLDKIMKMKTIKTDDDEKIYQV